MVDNLPAAIAIVAMALVTLLTRLAGPWLMRHVPATPRVEAFLKAMSTSVIAGLIVTTLLHSGLREGGAVLAAMAVMWLTRSAVAAMATGILTAAIWSAVAG